MPRKILFSAAIALALVIVALFAAHATLAGSATSAHQPSQTFRPADITPTPVVYPKSDNAYAVTYDHWIGTTVNSPIDGYRYANAANQTAQFTFTGKAVTWVTRKGTDEGKAQVFIDKVNHGVYDLYSVTFQENYKIVFSGLSNKQHTIVVQALGTKNQYAQDDRVAVNDFIVGNTTTQDNTPAIRYNSWVGIFNPVGPAEESEYRVSATAGAYVYTTFGSPATQIGWMTALGPKYGKATVTVDGYSQTVDLYAPTLQFRILKWFPTHVVFPGQKHWLKITVLGQKNSASGGTGVVIDEFYSQKAP